MATIFLLGMNSSGKTFHPAWFLIALLMGIESAHADFKVLASFMTNAIYRGYSKSRNNPAVSGNLEYEHKSGLYGGLWVSQISYDEKEYPDRANVEINPYLGWTYRLSADWRSDLSIGGYVYDGKLFGRDSDYNEFYASLHFRDLLTARVAFAQDAYQRNAATFAYELTGRYPLTDDWQISTGLGFYQASELLHENHFYWNVGLTWYAFRFLAADLRYVGTTAEWYPISEGGVIYDFRPKPLDQHLIFTLTLGF